MSRREDIIDFVNRAYHDSRIHPCNVPTPCLTNTGECIGTWVSTEGTKETFTEPYLVSVESGSGQGSMFKARPICRYTYNSYLCIKHYGKFLLVGRSKTIFTDIDTVLNYGLSSDKEHLVFGKSGLIDDYVDLGIKDVISCLAPHYTYYDDTMFLQSNDGLVGYSDKTGFVSMDYKKLRKDSFMSLIPSKVNSRFLAVFKGYECNYVSNGLIIRYIDSKLHYWIKDIGYMCCICNMRNPYMPRYEDGKMHIGYVDCNICRGISRSDLLRRFV